jgi:hypothetical protein
VGLARLVKEIPVKKITIILMVMLPILLTGCVSTLDEKVENSPDSDPRVGKQVNQICFSQTVRSWNKVDNDRDAVILVMNNRDSYKLKISSGCDPDWAMSHIAVIKRSGSSCYSRGDRIKTDGDAFQGYGTACTILVINKWDPEALNK